MSKRIGLLGGSFNPAHGGHRAISLFAMRALNLDEVWWLVSPGNPLKDAAGMAPLAHRLVSAERMARGARIRPTTIETKLGTRYTVDTLEALKKRWPRHHFIWLMGADNLLQFDRWRDWRQIARTVPIAVIARPGYNHAARAPCEVLDGLETAGARAVALCPRPAFSDPHSPGRSPLAPPRRLKRCHPMTNVL